MGVCVYHSTSNVWIRNPAKIIGKHPGPRDHTRRDLSGFIYGYWQENPSSANPKTPNPEGHGGPYPQRPRPTQSSHDPELKLKALLSQRASNQEIFQLNSQHRPEPGIPTHIPTHKLTSKQILRHEPPELPCAHTHTRHAHNE